MKQLFRYQDLVLKSLADRLGAFYLAGGTALAKFYFQHRESYDLDFFTQRFSFQEAKTIVNVVSRGTGKELTLIREQRKNRFAKLCMYSMKIDRKVSLKIDFVEDFLDLLEPLNQVNGIPVLSLEDIYLRKVHAVSGVAMIEGRIGQMIFEGGREQAKDFYDLYLLSSTFRNLSEFAREFLDEREKEGLIAWFRRFNRTEMKIGLSELRTHSRVEFSAVDKHVHKEIQKLIGEIV